MNTVLVRIPCKRFGVRVTLGQSEGLSTFEAFTLRLIASGVSSVERLAAELTLPLGVVLDTCVDLLRAGYIFLDHTTSAVKVTEVVLDEMGDPLAPNSGWTLRLAPAAAPSSSAYDLLMDLVSGAVFPSVAGLSSQGEALLAPEDLALGDVTDIQKPQLLAAAARLLKKVGDRRDERDPSRPGPLSRRGMRVTDVAIVGRGIGEAAAASPASIVVEVVRRRGSDDDRPNLVIVGPPELDGSVRRGLASRLMAMWDDGVARDRGQFFERLGQRLTTAETIGADALGVQVLDPAGSAAEFVDAVEALDDLDLNAADRVLERHHRLFELERRATADLNEGQALQADISLVINAAEHHEQLLAALREAKNQVVLVSPWVGQLERNKRLQDALVEAVGRGVRVHLVWGVDRDATFDSQYGPVSQELVQLLAPGEHRVGGLFVSPRPAGVHAKLIVCDTEWAIISSCNVLNSSEARREFELGVKIRPLVEPTAVRTPDVGSAATWSPADHRGLAAAAVCECIRFARSILPDYILRGLVGDDPTLDGRRLLAPAVEIGGEIESPDYPAIWRDTLRRRAEAVKERAIRLSPLAQPVIDGQHREFFVHALQTARRRIVVSSKDLGIGLLGGTVADLVLVARTRGVDVKVVHAGHADWSEDLQRRKKELEQSGVKFIVRDVHAKVLICDDWVIVSSFNFLSFAGYYDMHRRARHELGLRVVGGKFSDRIADLLDSVRTR